MKHQKVFNREDGSRVKVTLSLYVPGIWDGRSGEVIWNCKVGVSQKGENRYTSIFFSNGSQSSGNSGDTDAWIYETKLELWEKIKPTL